MGGSTTVNWTSSFRTPSPTLNYWADQFGLEELRPDAMAPWFDGREERHSMAPHRVRLFTAHQMGGCAMGSNPQDSVVNGFGEHHHVSNLSVHDASIFPTSIGANPQLSVYALAARNSTRLAQRLS